MVSMMLTVIRGNMDTQNAEMLEQINKFLAAMSPPDPDGMFSVAKVDSSIDPVELYRQSLAMGSGHVWYVGTEKCATAITGNGPRAKANAEFYAAAPIFVRWLLDKLAAANTRMVELEEQIAAIPVISLLAIEEIAPLIGRDVLGDPAAWMKAWDEVSPWLARLDMQRCQHEWVGQRQGGDPADAASNQWVVYCRLCGMERRAEDA